MENHTFYKKFQISVIVFFISIIILSIVWFATKRNNLKEEVTSEELFDVEKETINWENTDPSYWDSINWVENRDPSYYREDNIKLSQKFKDVIKELYLMYGIKADPEDYINFKVSIPNPEKYVINDWYFLAVDNYKRFLSDTAECNTGMEFLRSFISRIGYDDEFLRSRLKLKEKVLPNIGMLNPRFHFEYNNIVSWKELTKDKACLLNWYNQDDFMCYTFTRIDGVWYMTDFYQSFYTGIEE